MICESTRNRILALPDPAALSESLRAHMSECSACRLWHAQLIEVEAVVVAMTVPATDGRVKRQLLAQFQMPAAKSKPNKVVKKVEKPKAIVSPAPAKQSVGERLARLWPAGLVAAAVLVGAIAWSILGGKSNDQTPVAALPPDPMLKIATAAKAELDTADSTAKKVDIFARLAEELHEGARSLSKVNPGDNMNSFAKMYQDVVRDGLVEQARALSEDERRTTLPRYRDMLITAQQNANNQAAEAPEGSKQALKDIAKAAEAGRIELAKLIQGRAL